MFTKYDQFKRNIKMHLQDHPKEGLGDNAASVADSQFKNNYLHPLGEGARFVQLESGFRAKCLGYVLMVFW